MFPDGPAAAEGELGQTPFAHLASYALDKRITGEIFLSEPPVVASAEGEAKAGPVHVVRFESGVPTKIRVGDDFARLGELLVEREAITQATLEGALATHGGLLGDILVLSGYVESHILEDVLVEQFKRRMTRFYALPATAQFRYFDKSDTLATWGGDASTLDPFTLLWAGLEAHAECSLLLESTLGLLKGCQIKLHPRAPYQRFCLSPEATDVVELLALDPTSYEELLELDSVPVEVVRKVLYALVITRQLDLGKPTLPVGVEERPATVAKVALRSTVHRRGAAAPDAPGDGERTPVRPISIRRGSQGTFDILPREEDPAVVSSPSESTQVLSSSPGTPRTQVKTRNASDLDAASAKTSNGQPVDLEGKSTDGKPTEDTSAEDEPTGAHATTTSEIATVSPETASPLSNAAKLAMPPTAGTAPATKPSAPGAPKPPLPTGAKPTATKPLAPAAPKAASAKAAKSDDDGPSEDSKRRIIAEAMRGMPIQKLVAQAIERVEEKEVEAALEICRIARESDPESAEVRSVAIWARSLESGADLKVFSLDLDEALRADEKLVVTRFVRGVLRKRLGEDSGALADFKKVLELEPTHPGARREMLLLEPKSQDDVRQKGDTGFLTRLFRR